MGEILRRLLAGRDVDPADVDMRPLCAGCRIPLDDGKTWCADCGRRDRAMLRAEVLKPAYGSLPEWPWCRFGDPGLERLASASPDVFGPTRRWRPESGSLLLIGKTGIGKTAAMVAIAHRILDYARDTDLPHEKLEVPRGLRLIRAADIIRAKRNHPLGQGDAPLLTRAYEATVLLLDDLGREPVGDTTIYDVVDSRYWAKSPTIVSTNLTRAEIRARYGEAGERRICDLGRVVDHGRGPAN